MNLNELLTLNGLNKWLKTTSESYKNKEVSEIAKRIYKETINYKISDNPDYNVLYKEFNIYIKTVKNDGNYVLGLYEQSEGSMKFRGIVNKNSSFKPGFINSIKNKPDTKITPQIVYNPKYQYNLGVYVDPSQYLTASVKDNIKGTFGYNISSLKDGYNLKYGSYPLYITFVPEDLDTYNIANKLYYVGIKYPGFKWKNIKDDYVYGELSGSITDYISASFVTRDQVEIEGTNELNLESLDIAEPTDLYPVGEYIIEDYFIPTDTEKYEILTGSKKITVNKFTPYYTWDVSSSYDYRDFSLEDLENVYTKYYDFSGVEINGTHSYDFSDFEKEYEEEGYPDVGTYTVYDYFTPDQLDCFNPLTASKEITIEPKVPVLGEWYSDMSPYAEDRETFSGSFLIPEGFYTNNYLENVYADNEKSVELPVNIEYTPVENTVVEVDENNQFYISASITPESSNYVPLMDNYQVTIRFTDEEEAK